MPRYIIGAVSMKMSSRTSTTSTSGMMLISAIDVPTRSWLPGAPALNAIFGRAGQPRHRPAQDVEEIEDEAVHFGRPVTDAVDEVVVAHDGRDRGRQTRRRGDERYRDAGRDHGQA